jgi:hypothetical protein
MQAVFPGSSDQENPVFAYFALANIEQHQIIKVAEFRA